jgi:subtilisin-like proprotein convertase family protein
MKRPRVRRILILVVSTILAAGATVSAAGTKTFTAADTPLPIPPTGSLGITTSNIVVSESCLIEDLNVTVDIEHTWDADLFITLGETGVAVILSDRNGGSGDDYSNTTFDDEATTPIDFGTAPFAGSFKPEELLSSFDGTNALGTWTLTVDDRAFGDIGTLQSWSITAECLGGTSHYLTYKVKAEPKFDKVDVLLTDQLQSDTFTVDKRENLLVPVDKNGEGIGDSETHLLSYKLKSSKSGKKGKSVKVENVSVENQFGTVYVDVKKAENLLVPASKSLTDSGVSAPDNASHEVNHFLCYKVELSKAEPDFVPILGVSLVDQFESKLYDVVKPKRLCGPVDKNGEGIKVPEEPENHLLCYEVKHSHFFTNDQFGPAELDTGTKRELCVPSVATF